MIGYKAFNDDLTCRDFQYEVGKTYEIDDEPECCYKGFHFCRDLKECFRYYDFSSRVCVVESLGDTDTEDNEKFCTNKIKIIRELSFEEICNIIGIGVGLANNLIESFELTKEFFRNRRTFLDGDWDYDLNAGPIFWYVKIGSEDYYQIIGARPSRDFKKIEFFDWNDFDSVLFECDDKKIYQVNKLIGEDLKLFEYLKEKLKF